MASIDDLLIISDPRPGFFEIVEQSGTKGSVEVRLDRRRGQRRRADDGQPNEERRRGDRRTRDISEQLRTVGWALVPAAER